MAHFQPEATAMHANPLEAPVQTVIYPDSDGKPMADNTLQFRWIVTIVGNLETCMPTTPMSSSPVICCGIRSKATTRFAVRRMRWWPLAAQGRSRFLQTVGRRRHCAAGGVRGAVAGQYPAGDGREAGVL